MKKELFILLLTVELILGTLAMAMLMSDLGALCYLVSTAIYAVVLTPFYFMLKKTEDEVKKGKIRRNLILLLLLPILLALGAIVIVAITLLMYG